MTTLKTRLDEAVGTLEGDAQLLHQIVHGGDQTTVVTEGGPVKTVAHVIRQTSLELDASRQELTGQVATATQQASSAAQSASSASASRASSRTAQSPSSPPMATSSS